MEKQHICPWWLGYTLILPIRKYQHDPQKILQPHIQPEMKVMDYGSAMGYFSIPLAKMVGEKGVVFCVDIQQKMLEKLEKRAVKYHVSDVVKPLLVGKNYHPDDLQGKLDFALLFAVVHEVPDQKTLFMDVYSMLKPGGKIIFAEPKGHVKTEDFEQSLQIARNSGFTILEEKPMKKGLNALLMK
jgi:2-polyprenyl-3-methyl-5-hydroxy-6-metoxy-1,4-benzoquinol methylase